MRVAVKKLDGVDSVDVSLNQGLAVIWFRPDNRITLEQVREAIRNNGFTPKDAELRVRGRVREDQGGLALELPGQRTRFRLEAHPSLPDMNQRLRAALLGPSVQLEGTIPAMGKQRPGSETIQVREISVPPG